MMKIFFLTSIYILWSLYDMPTHTIRAFAIWITMYNSTISRYESVCFRNPDMAVRVLRSVT